MTSWHQETVDEVVETLRKKFSRIEHPFNLPGQTRESALYQPDIVVFDSNEVRYIIEVQTSNVRKSIAGATILAEVCVAILKQRVKPSLFFVVKDNSVEHELQKLERRIQLIRSSLKQSSLEKVELQRKEAFLANLISL